MESNVREHTRWGQRWSSPLAGRSNPSQSRSTAHHITARRRTWMPAADSGLSSCVHAALPPPAAVLPSVRSRGIRNWRPLGSSSIDCSSQERGKDSVEGRGSQARERKLGGRVWWRGVNLYCMRG